MGPIKNVVLRKTRKTRIRHQTASDNPYSNFGSDLTLPSLNQASEDPLRLATAEERARADKINALLFLGELYIHSGQQKDCSVEKYRVCSSGDPHDVKLEGNGETYSLMAVR